MNGLICSGGRLCLRSSDFMMMWMFNISPLVLMFYEHGRWPYEGPSGFNHAFSWTSPSLLSIQCTTITCFYFFAAKIGFPCCPDTLQKIGFPWFSRFRQQVLWLNLDRFAYDRVAKCGKKRQAGAPWISPQNSPAETSEDLLRRIGQHISISLKLFILFIYPHVDVDVFYAGSPSYTYSSYSCA